jgi:uncharacterized protein DUF5996
MAPSDRLAHDDPTTEWPALPYDQWRETRDTLHAHTQVLGKLAVVLAPPQPQLRHAALRLTARGWETAPLPAPDGSGAIVAVLDLRTHEAVVEHNARPQVRVALTPDRPVGEVTREVLDAVRSVAGAVRIDPAPQEVAWSVPLDEDHEHATYDTDAVARYHAAAIRAALVLDAYRASYRGQSTPVDAWWGSFDLAVHLFSGAPADPPSPGFIAQNSMDAEQIAVGWWPGDAHYPRAAFYGYAYPAPPELSEADVAPGRWDAALGEFLLDWDTVVAAGDPFGAALTFANSLACHACTVCAWDPSLVRSLNGDPPPVRNRTPG